MEGLGTWLLEVSSFSRVHSIPERDLQTESSQMSIDLKLFVSDEIKEARLALCEVCPHLRKNMGKEGAIEKEKCNLCGCYMPVKAKMKRYPTGQLVSCPAGKW